MEIRVPESDRPRDEGQIANASPALPKIPPIVAPATPGRALFTIAVTKPLSWRGFHRVVVMEDRQDGVSSPRCGRHSGGRSACCSNPASDCKHFTDVGGAGKNTFVSHKQQHGLQHLSIIQGFWRGVCWYLLVIIYNTFPGNFAGSLLGRRRCKGESGKEEAACKT